VRFSNDRRKARRSGLSPGGGTAGRPLHGGSSFDFMGFVEAVDFQGCPEYRSRQDHCTICTVPRRQGFPGLPALNSTGIRPRFDGGGADLPQPPTKKRKSWQIRPEIYDCEQ
jgi:hypothetical protein